MWMCVFISFFHMCHMSKKIISIILFFFHNNDIPFALKIPVEVVVCFIFVVL